MLQQQSLGSVSVTEKHTCTINAAPRPSVRPLQRPGRIFCTLRPNGRLCSSSQPIACAVSSAQRVLGLGSAGYLASVASPGLAVAEEIVEEIFLEQGPEQLLISAMFTVAVAALTVVTAGVGYLSLTSWLDSRAEKEDRQKWQQSSKEKDYADAMRSAAVAGKKQPSASGGGKQPKKKKKDGEEAKGFSR